MDDAGRVAIIDTPTIDLGGSGEVQTLRYQFSNHLGTASLELDEDANIISYEEYYPYGNSSYQAGRSLAEVSRKRYRYVGKERDEESGFIYIGARYYCPWLARWLAPDPINSEMYNLHHGNPGRNTERHFLEFTASGYEYCYANPLRFIDPTGEQPKIGYVSQQLAPNSHLPAHNGTYGGPTLADVTEAKIKKHSPVAAGIYKGTNNFIMHTFEGAVQTILHPFETVKAVGQAVEAFTPGIGFFSPQSAQIRAATFAGVNNTVKDFNAGDVTTKTAIFTEGLLTVGSLFFGAGEVKGTAAAGDAKYLFRGTSEGYAGNSSLQRLGLTPTSKSPAVATVFATNSEAYGKGILVAVKAESFGSAIATETNVLSFMEQEVVLNMKPADFMNAADKTITSGQARDILSGMNINIPSKINNNQIDAVLKDLPQMSKSQINSFYQQFLKQ